MLKRLTFILLVFTAMLSSCGRGPYIPKSLSKDDDLRKLISVAVDPSSDPAMRYAAFEPVISNARKLGEYDWITYMLGSILERNPGDPYGAYYLMAMAEGARDTNAQKLALDYLRRLLADYPDLIIRDRSIHLMALNQLADATSDPREAIDARIEMQRRFADRIDQGRNSYALAEDYREIGDWDAMYASLAEFLKYDKTVVPGIPDALWRARSSIEFHDSTKDWTMENLDDLVNTIKYAIRTNNGTLLNKYKSKKNFFFMNWSQDISDRFSRMYDVDVRAWLKPSIRYGTELEDFSNENEAYLWTSGWSWKIRTWYLYFRRVEYPADPEINGQWEWAGIYIGERL